MYVVVHMWMLFHVILNPYLLFITYIRACRMELVKLSRPASLELHLELQILGCACWQVSPFAAKSADGRLMRVPLLKVSW